MANKDYKTTYNTIRQPLQGVGDSETTDILTVSLIVLFHVRYIFLTILQTRTIALDALFYLIVLVALCTLKLNKYCLVLVPLVFLSLLNSAAQNIFLILSSSYIVSVKLPLRKLFKINVICIICVILSVVLMVKAGIVKEHIGTSRFYINGMIYNPRVRSDMGFGNPNRVAILVYSLVINLYLLIKKKHQLLFLIAVILGSYYIYTHTDSRTFILSITCFLLSFFALRSARMSRLMLKTRMVLFYIPIIFLIIIIYVSKIRYDDISLEILTSGRLGLFSDFINHCSLKDYLLGTNLINEKTIDNAYLHLLFSAGIFGLFSMLFLWYKLVSSLDRITLITYPILISITIYGFAESIWTMLLCYGNMIIWVMMIKNLILPNEYQQEIRNLTI